MDNQYLNKYDKLFKQNTKGIILTQGQEKFTKYSILNAINYLDGKNSNFIFIACSKKDIPPQNILILDFHPVFKPIIDKARFKYGFNFIDSIASERNHKQYYDIKNLIHGRNKNSRILTLCPSCDIDQDNFTKFIYKLSNQPNSILITSINYIENELLLNDMCNYNIGNYRNNLPVSLVTFLRIAKKLNWLNRVIDHYSQSGVNHFLKSRDRLSLYQVYPDYENCNNYTSIIFGNYSIDILDKLLPIDVYTVFGLMKTAINFQLNSDCQEIELHVPIWSILHKKQNGIFLSTMIKNKTNCCIGNYLSKQSSAERINCLLDKIFDDAKDRWKEPFTNKNFPYLTYKLDLLQDKNDWIKCPSYDIEKHFKLNGEMGVILFLQNGSFATYLPSVAKESQNDSERVWTIPEYLNNLTLKAYNILDQNSPKKYNWTHGGNWIKIYKTKVFEYQNKC